MIFTSIHYKYKLSYTWSWTMDRGCWNPLHSVKSLTDPHSIVMSWVAIWVMLWQQEITCWVWCKFAQLTELVDILAQVNSLQIHVMNVCHDLRERTTLRDAPLHIIIGLAVPFRKHYQQGRTILWSALRVKFRWISFFLNRYHTSETHTKLVWSVTCFHFVFDAMK